LAVTETKPIPIRFDPPVLERIEAAASRFGTNRTALIRFITETFLVAVESGTASLPPDWAAMLAQQERRPGPRSPEGPAATRSQYPTHRPDEQSRCEEKFAPKPEPTTKPAASSVVMRPTSKGNSVQDMENRHRRRGK
jgi:hypothetical protein